MILANSPRSIRTTPSQGQDKNTFDIQIRFGSLTVEFFVTTEYAMTSSLSHMILYGPGPVRPVVQVRVQSRSAPGPGHIPVPGPKGPKGSIGKTHPELFGICSGKIWFYTNIQDFIFVVDVLLALSKRNDAAFGPCFA